MPLLPDMNIKMLGYWSRLVFTMGFVFMNFFLMFCSSRSSSRGSTTRSHALPQSSSLVKSYRTESQESVNSDKTGANDDDKRPRGICINHLPIRSTGLWSVHFSVFFAVLISWRIIPNAKTAKIFIFESSHCLFYLACRYKFEGWFVSWIQEVRKSQCRLSSRCGRGEICHCQLQKVRLASTEIVQNNG